MDGVQNIDCGQEELYADILRQHTAQFKEHSSGRIGDELDASFLLPGTFWTPDEKDAFFHALCIYSRFRPDLISEAIGSKTVLDVCAYLDLLEFSSRETSAHSLTSADFALEFSDHYVKWEDEQSIKLATVFGEWEQDEIAKHYKSLLRSRLENLAQSSPDEDTREGTKEKWRREMERDIALSTLDAVHLRAMARILGEQTPAPAESVVPHEPASPNQTSVPTQSEALYTSPTKTTPATPADTLTPKSYRRYQKRMYMRRKRAEAAGEQVNENSDKLPSGRKAKPRKPPKPRPKQYKKIKKKNTDIIEDSDEFLEGGHEESDSSSSDDGVDWAHRHKGGLNKSIKTKMLYSEVGIDAGFLDSQAHSFFHLGQLGKLINNTRAASGEDTATECISSDTLQLLKDTVADFISGIVHHAIISRRQELRLKKSTKVWRLTDKDAVQTHNVHQALESMDLRTASSTYLDEADEEAYSDAEEDQSILEEEITSRRSSASTANAYKPIAQPVLPASFWSTFTRDELLSEEMDEDELAADLADDMAVDAADAEQATESENALWKVINKTAPTIDLSKRSKLKALNTN